MGGETTGQGEDVGGRKAEVEEVVGGLCEEEMGVEEEAAGSTGVTKAKQDVEEGMLPVTGGLMIVGAAAAGSECETPLAAEA